MAHRILLIEDEETILELFCIFLTSRGYVVDCAHDVLEAYAFCHQNRYSAVISDLNFDNRALEGLRIVEHFASQEFKPKLVVCSGFATQEIQEEALLRGADLFIAKPFKFPSLIDQLERLLKNAPMIDSVQRKVPVAAVAQHDDRARRIALPN